MSFFRPYPLSVSDLPPFPFLPSGTGRIPFLLLPVRIRAEDAAVERSKDRLRKQRMRKKGLLHNPYMEGNVVRICYVSDFKFLITKRKFGEAFSPGKKEKRRKRMPFPFSDVRKSGEEGSRKDSFRPCGVSPGEISAGKPTFSFPKGFGISCGCGKSWFRPCVPTGW